MKIRVYYEDTDVGGVVYHANYLKFCERDRSERFFQNGLMPYSQQGHFFIKKLQAEYKQSAKLGDLLEVKTNLVKISAASFVVHQEVWRDEEKLFAMDITIVYVDGSGKVKRFDVAEKAKIEELFGS